jgi:hypothetical protein
LVTGLAADFAGLATDFDSGLADGFGLDLITDLVSGLAGLPEVPDLAGTGLATACLLAAEVTDLPEDFLASGFTADAAFFRAGLADADLEDATGFADDLAAGFTADLAGGLAAFADLATGLAGLTATFGAGLAFTALFAPVLAAGFPVDFGVLDIVLAGTLAGVAGFFLTAAFMICLLSKSAPS